MILPAFGPGDRTRMLRCEGVVPQRDRPSHDVVERGGQPELVVEITDLRDPPRDEVGHRPFEDGEAEQFVDEIRS